MREDIFDNTKPIKILIRRSNFRLAVGTDFGPPVWWLPIVLNDKYETTNSIGQRWKVRRYGIGWLLACGEIMIATSSDTLQSS